MNPLILSFIAVAAGVIFVLFVLRRRFRKQTGRASLTLRKASESIVSILDLPKLLDYILEIILDALGVEMASVYLKNEEGKGYLQMARREKTNVTVSKKVFFSLDDPLAKKLRDTKSPLLREEVDPGDVSLSQSLAETDCALAMPLLFRNDLVGMLVLGEKSSRDIFSSLDLELLGTFSNQAVVAIENAKLFNQVSVMKTYNENILRSMTSGIVTVDNDHRITLVNEGAERLLGKPAKELMQQNTRALGNEIAALLKKTLLEGAVISACELEYQRDGQIPRVLSVSISPLTDSRFERQGAIAVLNDITQMKELQSRLQKGEKLAVIGTMAAGLAHEIKNPLVAVKTFIDLLPSKYEDVEFREKFSQVVKQEVERINEIVAGLLDFAHPKKPIMSKVRLNDILSHVLHLLSLQAKDARVEIVRTFEPSLPEVNADGEQIGRVFMNIALNAIQSMHAGGRLEVTTRANSRNIEIRFQDNGIGIAPENLQKIFDPFFSTKHKGTGLGLSICLKIVQDHGGDMRVKSSSQGTVFSIFLPLP